MKRKLLLAVLIAIAGSSQAQPVIQASQFDYPSASGFGYRYQSGQTAVAPGNSGANVQWDFSNLTASSTITYTTVACPGDADCAAFSAANQIVKLSTPAKVYYNKTATELNQVGEVASGSFTFSDPMRVLKFPITYPQSFSDNYSAAGVGGSRSGSLVSVIDGYGTLKTPTGTYVNVLRQKIVENVSVQAGTQNLQLKITHYYWMAADMHHYIMGIVATEPQNVPVPASYVTTYTTKVQGPVGISDKEALSASVTVHPNPATDRLEVRTDQLAVSAVSIFNVLGQKVLHKDYDTRNAQSKIILDNLKLAPGCYFLKLNTDKGLATKQVVIR